MYCVDTDCPLRDPQAEPAPNLVRRLAQLPAEEQFTTSVTLGELLYGASKRGSPELTERVRALILRPAAVLPFDASAGEVYGPLRATLESEGHRLHEPDLRIASIALSHGLTLVTGNVRHFSRVPSLRVENWLTR